jgi:hypothetical protein
MNTSSSSSSTSAQALSTDTSLSNSLNTALTNNINGEGSLAGQAALTRVEAAIKAKQAAN